jgi:hypothetical protein
VSIQDAAQAAVTTFPEALVQTPDGTFPLPVVMVAIAGAESGWDDSAQGDYGLGGPSCGGYTSWGLWQVHNVHAAYLTQQTGSSDPCVWARWLYDPANNAAAAWALLSGDVPGGLSNWTTWNTGAYRAYLGQAAAAVAAVGGEGAQGGGGGGSASGPESSGPGVLGSAAPVVLVGLFAVGLVLLGVADLEGWRL